MQLKRFCAVVLLRQKLFIFEGKCYMHNEAPEPVTFIIRVFVKKARCEGRIVQSWDEIILIWDELKHLSQL